MTRRGLYFDCSDDMAALLSELDDDFTDGLEISLGDPAPDRLAGLLKGHTLLVNGHTVMDGPLLKALAPELRRIVFLGTGAANYIDEGAADDLGIEVVTVPGYGDRSVAEHAFALLLAAARDIARTDQALRGGGWLRSSGTELKGKTVGVVGFGGIGREFASIAQAFGMNVQVWNRSAVDVPDDMRRLERLGDLFASSDAVSLHLAYTPETRNFIGRDLLAAMRPGSFLINTARAELVAPGALRECLVNGPIGHAAIDVFEPEPPSPEDPLLKLANVTLTPHIAWKTPDASRRLLELGLRELWK